MTTFDQKLKTMARREAAPVPPGFQERLDHTLSALPERTPARRGRCRGRRVLAAAAAVCAMLGVTAWAYVTSAFDFLGEREEFQYLGQQAIYEQYAQIVDQSQTAADGDTLRIERIAMDGNFCTIFYTLNTAEEMETWSLARADSPELWQAIQLDPTFGITVNGISITDIDNMMGTSPIVQERQAYLADRHTLYGVERLLLERPLETGERYQLTVGPSLDERIRMDEAGQVPPEVKWSFSLTAQPLETETVELDGPFFIGERRVDTMVLSYSPLGNLLRCSGPVPEEKRWSDTQNIGAASLGDFAIRDPQSGAYYAHCMQVWSCTKDPWIWYGVYEIYGDVGQAASLELIPAQEQEEQMAWVTCGLDALPLDSGDGYRLESIQKTEGQIIARLSPAGAAMDPPHWSRLELTDDAGNWVFHGAGSPTAYMDDYIDWRDGSITITWTLGDDAGDVLDCITQLQFLRYAYVLDEEGAAILTLKR